MKHIFHIKMRTVLWVMLGFACFAFEPSVAHAANCGGEPSVSSSASWQAYKSWCSCMGGSVSSNFNTAQAEGGCRLPGDSDSSSSSSGESAGTMFGRALGEALFGNKKNDSPGNDGGAARRAQEAEAEHQRQQAEADRIERDRIAKEKREKDEKDAKFISDRDEAARHLKGSSGFSTPHLKGVSSSELKGSSNNPFGLKDAVRDTGLKGSSTSREAQKKQVAAWKQVHCAASIAQYALAALQTKGDYDEFGSLSVEAFKAMDGQQTNVECKQAPAFPNMNGKVVNMDRVIGTERQLLERATEIAERMKQRGDKPGTAQQPKPPANETPDEKVRRVQRELNVINTEKNTGTTQQEISQKEKDRQELSKLVIKNNDLESGKLVSMSVDNQEEATPTPRRKSVPAP